MTIGFSYNLKNPVLDHTDAHAEYETPLTIDTIRGILASIGDVVDLPCEPGIVERIIASHPDVIMNIAEGWGGRDRESFIPALCEMLAIPFSGSDATALGVTMDKALTKRLARDAGVRTADFVCLDAIPDTPPPFGFPAFVKPAWDGSSKGISRASRVTSMDEYRERVEAILTGHHQPAIAEPYLDGREFCVGLLGTTPPSFMTTCEVLLGHEEGIPFFSHEYKRHDVDRLDFSPDVPAALLDEMEEMALAIWNVLGLRDYARMDFRTDAEGLPYFLEVNALPGLSPVSGIFVRQAAASGIEFDTLIRSIVSRALGEAGICRSAKTV